MRSQKPSASWSTADGSGTECLQNVETGVRGGLGYRLRHLEQSELLCPPLDRGVQAEIRLDIGQVERVALQPGEQVRPEQEVPVCRFHGGAQHGRRLELVAREL